MQELSIGTLKKYKEEEIADEIHYDSMSDISVWAEHYIDKHGRNGIKEYKWIGKTIDMKVFKLGRLQFEKNKMQQRS